MDDSTSLYPTSTHPIRNNHIMDSNKFDYDYGLESSGVGGVGITDNITYDEQHWDIVNSTNIVGGGGRSSANIKILPKVPIKHSLSITDSMTGSALLPGAIPISSAASAVAAKKTRRLPQPIAKHNNSSTRMLPQMPSSKNRIPLIRRSDTEYSDQDSLHSAYSYRPGAVSAIQYNEDYNYAYQSTDSLNTTQSVLSECGDRRSKMLAFSGAVPIVSTAIPTTGKSLPTRYNNQYNNQQQSTSFDLSDNNMYCNQSTIGDATSFNYDPDEYDDRMSIAGTNFYSDYNKYNENTNTQSLNRKRLPQTPNTYVSSSSTVGFAQTKQLPQIPSSSLAGSSIALETNTTPRKRLPMISGGASSKAGYSIIGAANESQPQDSSLYSSWNADNAMAYDNKRIMDDDDQMENGAMASAAASHMYRNSNSVFSNININLNNNNKLLDKASTEDARSYTNTISNFNDSEYEETYENDAKYDDDSTYDNYEYFGPKCIRDGVTTTTTTTTAATVIDPYEATMALTQPLQPVHDFNTDIDNSNTTSNSTNNYFSNYSSGIGITDTNATVTTAVTSSLFSSSSKATASFMKNSLSGYASKISTPITSPSSNNASGGGLSAAGSLGATLTSSIGMGISKTFSMFQSKTSTPVNQHQSQQQPLSSLTSPSPILNANSSMITSSSSLSYGINQQTQQIQQRANFTITAQQTIGGGIGIPPTITEIMKTDCIAGSTTTTTTAAVITSMYNTSSDDEMNHVTGNIVDYNTNDYKYMYDEYSENDYIATGDIISKKINYNNNYTNYSNLDSNSILNNQMGNNKIGDGNQLTGQLMTTAAAAASTTTTTLLPSIPAAANLLTNKNLYCDSASTNNAYNLINNQLDKNDKLSDTNYGYINGITTNTNSTINDHLLSSTHMYVDPHEAAVNNIVLKQQQEIDPNEVYEEDYEEDIIRNNSNNASANANANAYNHNYNQQYQTPYYNYQEDYFNEEDEYKYLEEEREEADLEEQLEEEDDDGNDHDLIGDGDIDPDMDGYASDDDPNIHLVDDNNKKLNGSARSSISHNKKRHLSAQESISDNDFFMQHYDGQGVGGVKNLNKQESIIEEDESQYAIDNKAMARAPSITTKSPNTITTIAQTIAMSSASAPAPVVTSRPLSLLVAMTTTTGAQALNTTKQPGDIVSDIIGTATIGLDLPAPSIQPAHTGGIGAAMIGGDATAMMMAAAKLATTATGSATTNKVDDVIDDINKKKQSIRSETDEQLNIGAASRKSEITAKQRWNWAYNKIIMQLNVSRTKKKKSFNP